MNSLSSSAQLDPELLDRYLAGELSADEQLTVTRWLHAHPEWKAVVDGLENISLDPSLPPVRGNVEADWTRLHAKMRGTTPAALQHEYVGSQPHRPKGHSGSNILGPRRKAVGDRTLSSAIFGTVGVVFLLLGWWIGTNQSSVHDDTSYVSTYTTKNGERATITLPDGTRAILNVASRLEIPTDFLRSNRTVRLSGEALFIVSHQQSAPFVVQTGLTATKVLGTSFVVRQYETDSVSLIAVRDGKVSVQSTRQSTVLTAAQQISVNRKGIGQVAAADATPFTFASGILSLRDASMSEAIDALNRWYDADIRLGDPTLASRRIDADCRSGSITDLVAILELTLNVQVLREGRVLTLYPKP